MQILRSKLSALSLGGTLLAVAFAPSIAAKEGANQYPNGVSGYAAGQLPPPGTYLLNYTGYVTGRMQDANGNDLIVAGKPVEVDAVFETPRIVHVSETELLGGNLFVHGLIPIVHLDGQLGGAASNNETGIGDLNTGIGISWPGKNVSIAASFDLYAPTGQYSDDPTKFSIGANYWSFEPVLAMTLLSDSGYELSFKAMYNIKLENEDTDIKSGEELKVDYHVGKRIQSENWGEVGFGIGGYYVNQLTEDENNGVKIAGTDGQVFAAGPQIKFHIGPAPVIIHYEKEFNAKSRLEGERLLLQVNYRF
ncbi:SphA family protein [Motiliproteus sp.]|uniref:SphA family protein n=1 Tax=Motiliproteus sp. TaxID=1898955 RepID=UPI003BAB282C